MKHNLYPLEADDDPCPDRPATVVAGLDESRFYPKEGECHHVFDDRVMAMLTDIVRGELSREDVEAYVVLGKTKNPGFYIDYGLVDGRMPSMRGEVMTSQVSSGYHRTKKHSWLEFNQVESPEELRILRLCARAIGLQLPD